MNYIKAFLILVLLLGAAFLAGWFLSPDPEYEEEIRYDTTEVVHTVEKPVTDTQYYPVMVTETDTFVKVEEKFRDIDTAAILEECRELYADYYLMREYRDTIINDTSALVISNAGVTQNRLAYNRATIRNRRATTIELRAREPPKYKISGGLFCLYNTKQLKHEPGAKISLHTGKNSFAAGYGFNKTVLLEYEHTILTK